MAKIKTCPTNYPSDVSDQEWEFCAPYLTLIEAEAPQREHCLRGVFNALRYLVKTGCQWRYLPSDFPPYYTVYRANGALGESRRLRSDGPRFAQTRSPLQRACGAAFGHGDRRTHHAVGAGERSAGRI